ncbi:ankyrin repeat-containing protein ITN1-like [Musa acuminata AAA Group]|uniref:ankyrin repeat-containing protein ITN1-like n=1 Tax=Musa acuminata AAA Group TaxID=214697 RepID=UPI0031D24943
MDPRLEEAAYAGDLTLLRRLLQEDRLLLHRQAIAAAHLSDSPLHIAASLGHSDLVREILTVNPELAHGRNREGLSALHLAAAQGHLSVVNELLQYAAAANICLATDNDGFMPAYTAALRGRLDVLTVLLDSCPESARAVTSQGDSIFHLTVKSNSFETVQFLLNRTDENDELLNSGDAKGNTVLHLAVARKQLQIVKLLLGWRGINANATNMRGDTVLDMLLDSPCQQGDLLLGELIRAAGGRTAAEEEGKPQPKSSPSDARASATVALHRSRLNWSEPKEKYNNKPATLMVVATLIATITFEAGLNPPGGFNQKDDVGSPYTSSLKLFLLFDMFGLFASSSIILLLICCVPRRKKTVMGILKWILWLAVFSTALAFSIAIRRI